MNSELPDRAHALHWKLYIIQEFCDGGSLSEGIDKGIFLTPALARKMDHILQVPPACAHTCLHVCVRACVCLAFESRFACMLAVVARQELEA